MILALAHSHLAPAFDAGLFFATMATIIPVLFLAIAVQGTLYQGLMKAAGRAAEKTQTAKAFALLILGGLILVDAALGELTAIWEVSKPLTASANSQAVTLTLSAAIVLTITVAGPPAGQFAQAFFQLAASSRQDGLPQPPGPATGEPAAPGEPASP
jgi:heme A synthase